MTREEWKQASADQVPVTVRGMSDRYLPLGPEVEVRIDEWVFGTLIHPKTPGHLRVCPLQLKSLRRLTAEELLTGEVYLEL